MYETLPLDLADRIRARVEDGSYACEADVIRDAIDALDEFELARVAKWEERNALAVEQSRLGLSKPLDRERLLADLKKRFSADRPAG